MQFMTQLLFLSGGKLRLSHQWNVNSILVNSASKYLWKCEPVRYYTWKLIYIHPQQNSSEKLLEDVG